MQIEIRTFEEKIKFKNKGLIWQTVCPYICRAQARTKRLTKTPTTGRFLGLQPLSIAGSLAGSCKPNFLFAEKTTIVFKVIFIFFYWFQKIIIFCLILTFVFILNCFIFKIIIIFLIILLQFLKSFLFEFLNFF